MKRISYNILYYLIIILFLTSCQNSQPKLQPLTEGDVILAFGDSLTYGTGATKATSYPTYLSQITNLEVINAGVPGEETKEGVERINKVLEKHPAQLVIVCLGGNDLFHKRPDAEIKENLKQIIETIQKNGAQVVLIGVPLPGLSLKAPDFYEELGEELNVPVEYTILPKLLQEPENKSDYVHLNAVGYKLFAEKIAEFLKKEGAINNITN